MQAAWQEGPCGGCPGSRACLRPAAGARTVSLLLCLLRLGGKMPERRRGGKKALKPGTGTRPHCHWRPLTSRHAPRLLPWPPRPRRATRRLKGQPARVSPAGIPGWGPHRARSARSQASKFPSRTSCWGCGPAGAVAGPGGLSCRGRGGAGGGGERQARGSCPGPRNLSHVGGTRLSREGTHTVYL